MAASGDGLAATRERRSNAGARMARLLLAEDEDDFYKTTYGGFNEVCYPRNCCISHIYIYIDQPFHPNIYWFFHHSDS